MAKRKNANVTGTAVLMQAPEGGVAALAAAGASRRTGSFEIEPDLLGCDEQIYSLRDRGTDAYRESVRRLADSIRGIGQIHPVLVRPGEGPGDPFSVIAGQCRVDAINLLRSEGVDVKVRCEVELQEAEAGDEAYAVIDASQALKLAGQENLGRTDFLPLERLRLFQIVRDRLGLKKPSEIAAFFGGAVDKATVTQTLRLEQAPPEVTEALTQGQLTTEGALVLMGHLEDKRAEILAKATSAAQDEAKEVSRGKHQEASGDAATAALGGKKGHSTEPRRGGSEGTAASASGSNKDKAEGKAEGKADVQVKAKHVRAAARELGAQPTRPAHKAGTDPAPKPGEVKDQVESYDGPGLKQPIRVMARTMLLWLRGAGSARALDQVVFAVNDLLKDKAEIKVPSIVAAAEKAAAPAATAAPAARGAKLAKVAKVVKKAVKVAKVAAKVVKAVKAVKAAKAKSPSAVARNRTLKAKRKAA